MNSLKLSIRRAGSIGAAFALVVSMALPTFVAADQVTARSIALSSSTADADGVTYQVNFTGVQAAGAILLDFCSDSPLIGADCTAPSGFSASGATLDSASTSAGYAITNAGTSTVRLTKTIGAGATLSFTMTGINNPTATGPLYARILTYTNDTHAAGYTDEDPDAVGAHKDDGGVAISITNKIGVSAAVLETLTFCVSGQTSEVSATNPVGAGCTSTTTPTLTLGETVGDVKALSPTAISTGDVYTQISTNAASGAVVSLKSGNTCGGLKRVGASGCDIAPAGTGGFLFGVAKVGVKGAADSAKDTALSGTGTLRLVPASNYNGTDYQLNFNGTTTGVASTYGDPILDTNGTQTSNKNMKLTFGASASNTTPAGLYSNDYSLIATGTF